MVTWRQAARGLCPGRASREAWPARAFVTPEPAARSATISALNSADPIVVTWASPVGFDALMPKTLATAPVDNYRTTPTSARPAATASASPSALTGKPLNPWPEGQSGSHPRRDGEWHEAFLSGTQLAEAVPATSAWPLGGPSLAS
jgi:hypothetical protein